MDSRIFLILYVAFITIIYSDAGNESGGTFLYFAYGSNLLARRLHINNPSAVFYSTAKLKDHRLDFNIFSNFWNGTAATIVEDPGETVWGDLWTLNISDLKHLDEQEMSDDWYFAKNVTVTTPQGIDVVARTYEEYQKPPKLPVGEVIPLERRPSKTYLGVIVLGAIESELPPEYISYLNSFPTNGLVAKKEIRDLLGYPFNVTENEK